MTRIFNFCAGPATLPLPVLEKARDEMLDYQGLGMSVMEISHRSAAFDALAEKTEACLRRLLQIPDEYAVLFLAGGATTQFAQVPLNLASADKTGAYIVDGSWSKKAFVIAQRLGLAHLAASSESSGFKSIPAAGEWDVDGNHAYLHYVSNETISGVQFRQPPETGLTLVSDMSSDILSRPVDVNKFGVIYAGAQKNIGQAGITLVVVRKDLLRDLSPVVPDLQSWKIQHKQGSRLNTPPTYAWYIAGLVFDWIEASGGVEQMARLNREKAETLYAYLDRSDFYRNGVPAEFRSHMNIPFQIVDESLHGRFISEAEAAGLSSLKGHRSVGGMRASIYNAMPIEGIRALIEFMQDFESRAG
ncbi:MAG: 3-phosphoserine/phosphohydroxythreonine transaminase [Gammaproteobacteria bacterium]|nr:3-phosphoserine/phosphohydroxythreonine transaminase [Gammaproteobacteria bacterium]